MKTWTAILSSLALAQAQSIAWDAVDAAPAPSNITVPIGAGQPTTIAYNPTSAQNKVGAGITAHPVSHNRTGTRRLPSITDLPKVAKRVNACSADPNDTADTFLATAAFANNAATPPGYNLVFQNLTGSSSTYACMG
jgi:hypothetical protein